MLTVDKSCYETVAVSFQNCLSSRCIGFWQCLQVSCTHAFCCGCGTCSSTRDPPFCFKSHSACWN